MCTCFGIQAWSQTILPTGQFLQDSLQIGEEVEYSLAIKYPRDWQIIFPDSTYGYMPFEYSSHRYTPTSIDSTWAYDSVIYTVSTFEIDLVQKLQLPIYVLQKGDSIKILSDFDSIYLQPMIQVLPDSIALRSNVAFEALDYSLNYLYLGIGAGLFVLLVLGILFFFGKNIRARYKVYLLSREYKRYQLRWTTAVQAIQSSEDTQAIEALLLVWKSYMESLENKPYTKYTTKEILLTGYADTLQEVLQTIDQSIYGKLTIEDLHHNLEVMNQYTAERFDVKKAEVNHG
ncbi:hypothetical protein BFP72_10910 [Reichenbachiella sp. 5M10]|uniref:hypothetical protein n=1 Tax=Reichenbachiella sp. 5M10 TaxID=1889772 RepID=UPI000C15F437|nr:hypothetical protein [Reichenbachiella sp. 5M10]PIB35867.1 hypothetical protein BFP72_10910 [Reichenbachiella sp. 5M10]